MVVNNRDSMQQWCKQDRVFFLLHIKVWQSGPGMVALVHSIHRDPGSFFFFFLMFNHVHAPFSRSPCPRWVLEVLPSYLHINLQEVGETESDSVPLSGSCPQ